MSDVTLQTEDISAASLDEPQVQTDGAPLGGPGSMIVFESVTKVYEPDVTALRDVSFVIEKGEFVFVVGASGSGKSTIVRLLLKELEPTRGRIVVGGRDLTRLRQQRVSIARAFVNHPPLLVCDEPTGNLDPDTSVGIMQLLYRINRAGTTILMVTHDREMVDKMRRRVIALEDGRLARDERRGGYES